jgi:hypothetical protein
MNEPYNELFRQAASATENAHWSPLETHDNIDPEQQQKLLNDSAVLNAANALLTSYSQRTTDPN